MDKNVPVVKEKRKKKELNPKITWAQLDCMGVYVIGGSRRRQAPSFFFPFRSFAYQYHWPSGTFKYRHDEVEREREIQQVFFFLLRLFLANI